MGPGKHKGLSGIVLYQRHSKFIFIFLAAYTPLVLQWYNARWLSARFRDTLYSVRSWKLPSVSTWVFPSELLSTPVHHRFSFVYVVTVHLLTIKSEHHANLLLKTWEGREGALVVHSSATQHNPPGWVRINDKNKWCFSTVFPPTVSRQLIYTVAQTV